MVTKWVEQVEFRWQPGSDFGPISYSFEDGRQAETVRNLLSAPATPPGDVSPGHRSMVYLTFPQHDMAAIIERSFDSDAVPVHAGRRSKGGGRNALVARALFGAIDDVDIELALACEWRSPFNDQPGQVLPGARLGPYSSTDLRDFAEKMLAEADDGPRGPRGLDKLVAAALREPGKPITVLLPGSLLAGEEALQGAYLRGLCDTAGVLLTRADQRWWPTFTTFEQPGGRQLPYLVFRDVRARAGVPPTQTRNESVLRPQDPDQYMDGHDVYARVAECLTRAYRDLGRSRLTGMLRELTDRYAAVPDRIASVLRHEALSAYGERGLSIGTGEPSGEKELPEPEDPVNGDGRPYLADLYNELDAQRGNETFFEVVEWICDAAEQGATLPEADAEAAFTRCALNRWYQAELEGHYGGRASARVAGLMSPLLAARLDEDETVRRLHTLLADPTAPVVLVRAVSVLCSAVDHRAAEELRRKLAPALLTRLRARQPQATPVPVAATPVQSAQPWWSQRLPVPFWALGALPALGVVMTFLLMIGRS